MKKEEKNKNKNKNKRKKIKRKRKKAWEKTNISIRESLIASANTRPNPRPGYHLSFSSVRANRAGVDFARGREGDAGRRGMMTMAI